MRGKTPESKQIHGVTENWNLGKKDVEKDIKNHEQARVCDR